LSSVKAGEDTLKTAAATGQQPWTETMLCYERDSLYA
uniref:Transposase n=1 Tax=Echinostoma caproni TaxID=27848 RepID=A0A183A320_9TREM